MMDLFSTLVVGDIMSGWQDSLMLKLALQLVGDKSSITSQSPISRRIVAEVFTADIFMKSVGDRSATDRRLFGDLLATDCRLLENLCN